MRQDWSKRGKWKQAEVESNDDERDTVGNAAMLRNDDSRRTPEERLTLGRAVADNVASTFHPAGLYSTKASYAAPEEEYKPFIRPSDSDNGGAASPSERLRGTRSHSYRKRALAAVTIFSALVTYLVWNMTIINKESIDEPSNVSRSFSCDRSQFQPKVQNDSASPESKEKRTTSTLTPKVKKEHEKWSKQLHHIAELDQYPKNAAPKVNWNWHPKERSERFPSVNERIEYYMGKWFNTTVPLYGNEFRKQTFAYQKTTREYGNSATLMINVFDLSPAALLSCFEKRTERVKGAYCRDFIDLAILHTGGTANVIMHSGDKIPIYRLEADRLYPVFNKVRHYCGKDPKTNKFTNSNCKGDKIDAIIWPLNRHRHFGPPCSVPEHDRPWKDKRPKAFWRGGPPQNPKWRPSDDDDTNDMKKWNLVSKHVNSTLVDAKYAQGTAVGKRFFEDFIRKEHIGKYTLKTEQLRHKYLISIEGNDVSSGFKWMLLSNSLLFVPPMGYESFAMEGFLKPFVHYVPIDADMSNVEKMVQWAEDHPEKAQQIAERGSLFIYDLLFHPDALRDEELVLQGIMERYEKNFGFSARMAEIHPLKHIHFDWHPPERRDRFPNVEQRTKYYMAKWYNEQHPFMNRRTFRHPSLSVKKKAKPELGIEMIVDGELLSTCAFDEDNSLELRRYCEDALPDFDQRITTDLKPSTKNIHVDEERLSPESSIEFNNRMPSDQNKLKRILFDDSVKVIRFGDVPTNWTDLPVFGKSRWASKVGGGNELTSSTLWDFDYNNEFSLVQSGLVEKYDVPFQAKDPRAFWWGGFGTKGEPGRSKEFKHRYNLVRSSLDTCGKLVVARFVVPQEASADRMQALPGDMIETQLEWKDDDPQKLLKLALSFRYIIASEDDYRINSDLKWMLLSQSVVLMPQERRYTSWFMEDLLEPYVHYVPIATDYSDVEAKIKWCEDHPKDALRISERATLYVHDMLFDASSDKDNSEVKFRIMETYARHARKD